MIDTLVQHEGIGMVIGYDDNMMAVALGKGTCATFARARS